MNRLKCDMCGEREQTHVMTDDNDDVTLCCAQCAKWTQQSIDDGMDDLSSKLREMRNVRDWMICTPGPAFYCTADVRAMKRVTERSGVPRSAGDSLEWARKSSDTYVLTHVLRSGRRIGYATCSAVKS